MSPDGFALVHIAGALTAIAGGAFAFAAHKGGAIHRRGGLVFAYAMLVMLAAAIGMALIGILSAKVMTPHVRLQRMNMVGAMVAFYLVATGWLTVRRPARGARWLDMAATALAIGACTFLYYTAFSALASPKGRLFGFPALPMLIFGTISLLAIVGDVRLFLGRTLPPAKRLARHLWRMGFGMFTVTGSFFIGQSHNFPDWLRNYWLLAIPPIAVIVLMFYWWGRMLITKRMPGAALRRRARISAIEAAA